jgi:hypothetical protein
MEFRTCTYIRHDGNICKSAAVTDRNLCLYHLEHRARLMRMAQYRARGQRFDLQLPPLESMHAVQSALTQLSEALAADMIELKRADRLIRVLSLASRNLLKADKWPASPYHSDQPAPAVDLTADYGLPSDLDLNLAPDVAFPKSVILSEERSDESKDPFVSASRIEMGAFPDAPKPWVRDYEAEAEAAMNEVQPEDIELQEIMKKYGYKAWDERSKEHQRNERRRRQRKYFRANYDRFVAEAKARNIQRAAEKLLQEKLAELDLAAKKPPASVASGETIAPREEATA